MKQGERSMNENAIALTSTSVPAHVKEAAGLGNENVTSDHLQTPRVKLLQQLSNEVDPNHEDHLEGAKPGDFVNTVTNKLLGRELYIINLLFKEEFVVWRKLSEGGGLKGTFATHKEAMDFLASEELKVEDHDIVQTQSHTLLMKDPATGDIVKTPFLMDFASSKLRVSREWNTQIAQLGGDRFSSLWKLASVQTQNRAAQKFYNLSVENQGWVLDEDYNYAKSVYDTVS